MTVSDFFIVTLVLLGSMFSLLAAVGIVRMPDLYTRMQSATKAGTLGVACIVIAAAIHFGTALIAVQALLVIIFFFATAPIGSHLIARASYVVGVALWSRTVRDDFEEGRTREPEKPTPDAVAASDDGIRRADPKAEREVQTDN